MKRVSLNAIPEESVSHNPDIKKRVMLRSGDLPHLTNFAQARFAPGQIASAHAHPDMGEVFFVEAGHGTMYINTKPHPLTPGTCIAIEPGEVHEVVNDGPDELVLNYFGLQA
jgi:mannose-6-phosphate isomerase-like protein (cupin superfamily)